MHNESFLYPSVDLFKNWSTTPQSYLPTYIVIIPGTLKSHLHILKEVMTGVNEWKKERMKTESEGGRMSAVEKVKEGLMCCFLMENPFNP